MQRKEDNNKPISQALTIPKMFNWAAVNFSDRRCQWFQPDQNKPARTTSLSYAEVSTRVKELSAGLMALGIRPRDRIIIMAANCVEWLWCDLAVMGAGGVTVSGVPAADLKEITVNTGARAVFIGSSQDSHELQSILDNIPAATVIVMSAARLFYPEERLIDLDQLTEKGRNYLSDKPEAYDLSCRNIKPGDSAAICYSPAGDNFKYTKKTHHDLMCTLTDTANLFKQHDIAVDEHDILLSFLPPAVIGARCGLWQALMTGGTIAYADQTKSVLRDFSIFHPTWFQALPENYEKIFLTMQDAYSSIPEGRAMFDIAIEIGLEMLAYRSKELTPAGQIWPDELHERGKWADEQIFSRFRLLFGEGYRFSVCTQPGLSSDLIDIYLAMGIKIINNLIE